MSEVKLSSSLANCSARAGKRAVARHSAEIEKKVQGRRNMKGQIRGGIAPPAMFSRDLELSVTAAFEGIPVT